MSDREPGEETPLQPGPFHHPLVMSARLQWAEPARSGVQEPTETPYAAGESASMPNASLPAATEEIPAEPLAQRISRRLLAGAGGRAMKLYFRNDTPERIWIAVAHYSPDTCREYGDWATIGWFHLVPGQQAWVISTNNLNVYYYAESETGRTWSGREATMYVYAGRL